MGAAITTDTVSTLYDTSAFGTCTVTDMLGYVSVEALLIWGPYPGGYPYSTDSDILASNGTTDPLEMLTLTRGTQYHCQAFGVFWDELDGFVIRYGSEVIFTSTDLAGYIWTDTASSGTEFTFCVEPTGQIGSFVGTAPSPQATGQTPGQVWVEGTYFHYIDYNGDERRKLGSAPATFGGDTGQAPAQIWIEGVYLHYIDESGDERRIAGL